MSKIYEALLRAEMDRLASGENDTESPLPSEPRKEETSAWSIGRESRPVTHFEPVSPVVSNGVDRVNTPSANLALVSLRSWVPVMDHLPALEERGGVVEQFRSLRSRLYQFRDLNTLKTIAICSALPQEGKSFIAVNLAISLARHKSARVLLIDGDMRRGTLHTRLGVPNEPGLAEYLSGRATLVEVMQQGRAKQEGSALPAGLSSLTFISSGGDAENVADLSGSERFPALIAAVQDQFEWIIVDTSPVNLVSDGINLARASDGVLMVVRGGVTKFKVAQRGLQELKAVKVLGVVLNAVPDAPVVGSYYGYERYEKSKT